MAQQIYGDTRVSCREMSRRGAFHVSRIGFGEALLIDAHALPLEHYNALRPKGVLHDADVLVDVQRDDVVGFSSPFASIRRSLVRPSYTSTRSYIIRVLELKDHKWALAAIHADLLPKGRSFDEAIEVYDTHFARSAHDSFEVRRIVKSRTT